MISTLALSLLVCQGASVRNLDIPNNQNIAVQQRLDRLEPAQVAPKIFGEQRWEFDWVTWGFGGLGEKDVKALRLRVFSQERKGENDKAPMVARMAMQIWDRCFHRFKLDHVRELNHGIVDFYLCFGGEAGGEQLLGEEIMPNQTQPVKVNTIYIYKMQSFTDPIEMAREVAHEYGHAILPPIGGFKQPEVWASGYLGEKIFLKWIRDGMISKQLGPEDAMGASLPGLNSWIAANVDKPVTAAATQFPESRLINESRGGMDAFTGLAMYVEALCPPSVFLRALQYTRDAHFAKTDVTPPTDFAEKVVLACSEVENLTFSVPIQLMTKKPIWIPLGKGTLSGATVISRREGWAQVVPLMQNIVVKNPKLG
jgi:hypothetical protein